MLPTLTRLHPAPHASDIEVRGLYLAERLHAQGTATSPFVYADFVTSLDGRIAVHDAATGRSAVPRALTTSVDLRLLLELAAQADCIVTHAGYLRALARGELGDILQIGTVRGHADLVEWREANGLRPQPAVCIASASLDFVLPPSLAVHGQEAFVVTGRDASPARRTALEARGCEVLTAGETANVEGSALAHVLARKGMRTAFLLAGPRLLEATLRDGVLARLYVTLTHDLVGGTPFHSMIEGPPLAGAGRLRLRSLHLAPSHAERAEQLFAQFEPVQRRRASDHSHSSSA